MSTAVWPPISDEERVKAEEDTLVSRYLDHYLNHYLSTGKGSVTLRVLTNATQAQELEWLLEYLQETLESFKEGLEECRRLLAPTEPGSTLAMSSVRSEAVKGYVNRVAAEVVKGVSLSSSHTHAGPVLPSYASYSYFYAVSCTSPAPHRAHASGNKSHTSTSPSTSRYTTRPSQPMLGLYRYYTMDR